MIMIKKELNTLYPGFVFNELAAFTRRRQSAAVDEFDKGDVVLMPRTEYNKIPYVEMNIFNFFISSNEYKYWLTMPYGIIFHPVLKDIPHPISACRKLFDKNVLPIKKLVEDIGDLNNLTIKETKNFFYMTIVIWLAIHFLQNLIRKYSVTVTFHCFIITVTNI